jgi:hypothetical protein
MQVSATTSSKTPSEVKNIPAPSDPSAGERSVDVIGMDEVEI